ncbi:hypothetical protein KDL01_21115 [Actinospica durhamensis]|uniref:Secreted protein n=1 Tax=Actinospica durhamensis TaxID=1508375 RepID=A0A941EPZ1_9ACTN|nr:hypothetical protein [Actinospica durhamensis]MBR7835787.1 hypothetical protein [Actinospica durhamensis]
MAILKKASTVAVLATAAVMGAAGAAFACGCQPPAPHQHGHEHGGSDNQLTQAGLIPVNLLNNTDVSPNVGCAADGTLKDLTAQSLIGAVPIGLALNHLLEHANLNVLANGNTTTEVQDDSCTSNQGSSQAGNDSHGSWGAGSSSSEHNAGDGAGSGNSENGEGAGGLIGGTGILGTGL